MTCGHTPVSCDTSSAAARPAPECNPMQLSQSSVCSDVRQVCVCVCVTDFYFAQPANPLSVSSSSNTALTETTGSHYLRSTNPSPQAMCAFSMLFWPNALCVCVFLFSIQDCCSDPDQLEKLGSSTQIFRLSPGCLVCFSSCFCHSLCPTLC